jgi:hypothetical protein
MPAATLAVGRDTRGDPTRHHAFVIIDDLAGLAASRNSWWWRCP